MTPLKITAIVSGLILVLVGLLGSAVSLFAIFDPAGTQMADDANPFGAPPTLRSSLLILVLYLCVCGIGVLLTWRSVRKRRVSA